MIEAKKLIVPELVLNTVKKYHILDTLPEKEYDDITFLASMICETSVSLITILDSKRQFFKSNHGIDIKETNIEHSFCIHTISKPHDMLLVPDTRLDNRFAHNPLVLGYPNVAFYAGVPLLSEEGTPLGTLCVIDDKPKQLTNSQVKALKSLANQVQRLLELRRNNTKLEEAKILQEVHSSQMEDFAYMAAHDLQAPLNISKSFLSILNEKNNHLWDEEDKGIINHMDESFERMGSLIKDLLAYSQISEVSLEYTKTNLSKLIKDVFANISIDDIDNVVDLDIQEDIEHMLPQTALQIVFHNLLVNSLKFVEKNIAPKIHIQAKIDKGHWIFSIKDNGIGISANAHEKIFQPFERAHGNTHYKGNGLGLSTCKKIVEKHGGKIWVESYVGSGSTFYFSLEKPIHILLVEDSEGDIILTTEALQESKLRHYISIVRDGNEAINFLNKSRQHENIIAPDLVLLDINLPKKNGHEVLLFLKNTPHISNLSVIMISTSTSDMDLTLSSKNKADAYLVKPLEAKEFDLTVSKLKPNWAHHFNSFTK